MKHVKCWISRSRIYRLVHQLCLHSAIRVAILLIVFDSRNRCCAHCKNSTLVKPASISFSSYRVQLYIFKIEYLNKTSISYNFAELLKRVESWHSLMKYTCKTRYTCLHHQNYIITFNFIISYPFKQFYFELRPATRANVSRLTI